MQQKNKGSGDSVVGLLLCRRLNDRLPLVRALDSDAGRLAVGSAVRPLVCPDAVVAGPQAGENCQAPSSGRVLPSRDAVPAGAAAVFGHNRHLAVQSDRSALVGGHGRSNVGQFRHGWRNVATVTSPPEMHIKAECKGSPMTRRVLIDYQARGREERNEPTIEKEYSDIRYVRTEPNPAAAPD